MKDYPDKMTVEQARRFGEDVLNIVSQIPRGKVTTYGYIAALAGWPSHSRMVGRRGVLLQGGVGSELYWKRKVWSSRATGMWIWGDTFGSPGRLCDRTAI